MEECWPPGEVNADTEEECGEEWRTECIGGGGGGGGAVLLLLLLLLTLALVGSLSERPAAARPAARPALPRRVGG
jgi:hypothetical protein